MTDTSKPDPRRQLADLMATLAESANRIAAIWWPTPDPEADWCESPLPYGAATADKQYTARELLAEREAALKEAAYHRMRANELAEHVKTLKMRGDKLGKERDTAEARVDAARTIVTALRVYPDMHASLDLIDRALDGDMPKETTT